MNVKVELVAKRYFLCPKCKEHEFCVEHLFENGTNAGPWYCDTCDTGWMIVIDEHDNVHVEERPKIYREWLLLSIGPTDSPVYLRVPSVRFTAEQFRERTEFYIEINTCPTNLLKRVDEIWFDGDADPHGILRVVSVHDKREDATPVGCYHNVQDDEPNV